MAHATPTTRFAALLMALVAALTLAAVLAPGADARGNARASVRACPSVDARPGEVPAETLAASAVCLVNNERSARGMRRLRRNEQLAEAARRHTLDMINRRFFDHTSPSGKDVVDRLLNTGYIRQVRSWLVGENLAWGTGGRSTPREIVASWMGSPGHRENILNRRYREIGMGVVLDIPVNAGLVGATYTTTFGARRK